MHFLSTGRILARTHMHTDEDKETRTHICMYIRICTCTYTRTYTHAHALSHSHTHMHMYIHLFDPTYFLLEIACTPTGMGWACHDSFLSGAGFSAGMSRRAEILACQLSVLVKMEDHQRTLHVLDALEREDPTFEDVWSYRGDCLTSLGKHCVVILI